MLRLKIRVYITVDLDSDSIHYKIRITTDMIRIRNSSALSENYAQEYRPYGDEIDLPRWASSAVMANYWNGILEILRDGYRKVGGRKDDR